MKKYPSKIQAVPQPSTPLYGENGDGVMYCRASDISEEETISGLLNGTVREWHTVDGETWVQIVPAERAFQMVEGVGPDPLFLGDFVDDFEDESDVDETDRFDGEGIEWSTEDEADDETE